LRCDQVSDAILGSSQKFGCTARLELSEVEMLLATSRCVRLNWDSFDAIDVQMQIGRIDHVTHVSVNESRDGRNPLSNTARDLIVSGVVALYWNIERRGQTKVQDLRDYVCRLKEKVSSGNSVCNCESSS
jgi:hypothetical protein